MKDDFGDREDALLAPLATSTRFERRATLVFRVVIVLLALAWPFAMGHSSFEPTRPQHLVLMPS
jgi:hypothetical protein